MTIVVLVILGAMLVGKVRGGSARRLAMLRLPRTSLVIAAGFLSVIGQYGGRLGLPARPAFIVATVLSALLAGAFVAANWQLVGVPLIAIGFFLNALVIIANGAMPVSQRAADFAEVSTDAAADGSDSRHEILTPQTRLAFLADVIPLRAPKSLDWASNVYSAGDIVLAAGIGLLVMGGMERPGAGRLARQVSRGRLTTIDLTRHEVELPSAELRLPSSFPAPW